MERITGIGGLFFRARDPQGLGDWYFTHLGINPAAQDYDGPVWRQTAGITVFAPFQQQSDYFGSPDKNWAINFRVRDLERMVEQLRNAGIEVTIDPEVYPNGRFATLYDPEGNRIDLWQPDPAE
ncbi:VOC family protein [Rhizobium sp. KVB221]|uniref:VOC family protein n=1 Tax=Rhizobium setariae TaxID=2801340 RepID=A0A936YRU3_9HYPH|nr:VOC family protein [Rhizobium setariae]MBL0374523.1 VOC family protein [Rhizobium setariae]